MRFGVESRHVAGETMTSGAARRIAMRGPMPVYVCAIALVTTLLAGCDLVLMPDAALLEPQPPPQCDAKGKGASRKQPTPNGATQPDGDDAALRKLDYQVQCYRHAEMIARHRLSKLQESL